MATDGTVPTFGLWYDDFRQKPPLGDYASFCAGCFEGFEKAPRVRDAVKA